MRPTIKQAEKLERKARRLWRKRTLADSWQNAVAVNLWNEAKKIRRRLAS